jgi:hypothetical protein
LIPGGKLLVSLRNTWAAYLVNAATGNIEWTLGGKRSDYRFGPGASFQWQHDVSLQSPSSISMYDDHCCQITSGGKNVPATGDSRALLLHIDQSSRTATLAAQFVRARGFAADYMGNAQPLPHGGVFVGWGSEPYFSEYGPSGQLLLDAELPWPDVTYRATLAPWVGLPLTKPAGAARRAHGATTVYASWNGATELTSWRVLAAASGAARLTPVTTVSKSGFETAIPIPSDRRYTTFQLQALDVWGHVLGISAPFSATSE